MTNLTNLFGKAYQFCRHYSRLVAGALSMGVVALIQCYRGSMDPIYIAFGGLVGALGIHDLNNAHHGIFRDGEGEDHALADLLLDHPGFVELRAFDQFRQRAEAERAQLWHRPALRPVMRDGENTALRSAAAA